MTDGGRASGPARSGPDLRWPRPTSPDLAGFLRTVGGRRDLRTSRGAAGRPRATLAPLGLLGPLVQVASRPAARQRPHSAELRQPPAALLPPLAAAPSAVPPTTHGAARGGSQPPGDLAATGAGALGPASADRPDRPGRRAGPFPAVPRSAAAAPGPSGPPAGPPGVASPQQLDPQAGSVEEAFPAPGGPAAPAAPERSSRPRQTAGPLAAEPAVALPAERHQPGTPPRPAPPAGRERVARVARVAAPASRRPGAAGAVTVRRGPAADAVTQRTRSRAAADGNVVFLPDRHGPLSGPVAQGLLAHELVHATWPRPGGPPTDQQSPTGPEAEGAEERAAAAAETAARQGGGHAGAQGPGGGRGGVPVVRAGSAPPTALVPDALGQTLYVPTASDGTASDGTASDGTASDGAGSDGTGSDGTGSDGAGSDGAGSDGAGSDGTGSTRTAGGPGPVLAMGTAQPERAAPLQQDPPLAAAPSSSVRRAPEAPAAAGPVAHPLSAEELDRVYQHVAARLRCELLVDRERVGRLLELAWR